MWAGNLANYTKISKYIGDGVQSKRYSLIAFCYSLALRMLQICIGRQIGIFNTYVLKVPSWKQLL